VTLTRSLLISFAIHILLLLLIFITAMEVDRYEPISDSVRIRLISSSIGKADSLIGRERAEIGHEKFKNPRQIVPPSEIGKTHPDGGREKQEVRQAMIDERVRGKKPANTAFTAPAPSVLPSALDPLAGLEEVPRIESESRTRILNPWNLSWINGSERGILSFPMVDVNEFPDNAERLLNTELHLRVSPEGEVISAEIVPPGSGDIRIDRYMHSAALQLILEPWPAEQGVQEGRLRLIFLGTQP